jgi:hypothetical protein
LAKGQDVDLSSLLGSYNASLLIVPAYTSIDSYNDWDCEGYNNEFLRKLDIQVTLQEYLATFIVFDSKEIKKQIIFEGRSVLCGKNAPRLCLKLDNVKLSIDTNDGKHCFRVSSKANNKIHGGNL